MSFDDVVEPSQKLIDLFKKIPSTSLADLPNEQLSNIQNRSKYVYSLFAQISEYRVSMGDPESTRKTYISNVRDAYQPCFNSLFPIVSYIASQTIDFAQLESRGRAAVQSVHDEKDKILAQLHATTEQAEQLLQQVRELAAEQGVTQMASYFAQESTRHSESSKRWLIASGFACGGLLAYAVFSLFLTSFFVARSQFEAIQLISSKLLIFLVLSYGLIQCVRVYSAHRHNAVTNRHRQNALLTYRTLSEAASSPELRDAVLQHAAAAIYAPNDSGYLRSEERGYGSQGLMALVPRVAGSSPTQPG